MYLRSINNLKTENIFKSNTFIVKCQNNMEQTSVEVEELNYVTILFRFIGAFKVTQER